MLQKEIVMVVVPLPDLEKKGDFEGCVNTSTYRSREISSSDL